MAGRIHLEEEDDDSVQAISSAMKMTASKALTRMQVLPKRTETRRE